MQAIKSNHPIREAIASLSSGRTYYPTIGAALRCIETILNNAGFGLADTIYKMPCSDDGRTTIGIVRLNSNWNCEQVGLIVFTWHRMELSGLWEIVTYVA